MLIFGCRGGGVCATALRWPGLAPITVFILSQKQGTIAPKSGEECCRVLRDGGKRRKLPVNTRHHGWMIMAGTVTLTFHDRVGFTNGFNAGASRISSRQDAKNLQADR